MPDIIDLGGAPAEAECAQIGQTANFAAVNAFEVEVYRLAIIARYGPPPAGCRLAELANDHDFGTYRTLTLRIADDAGPEALAYADQVEPGLDVARLPQQALDRLIQSHPDARLVDRLRAERFQRAQFPCNDIGTTNG